MKPEQPNKKFIFDEKVDKEFIFSMYEDDYVLMAEVFTSSLESLDEDIPALNAAFEAGDTLLLKKAAHKVKPVFGFTGLLIEQDAIGIFENACLNITEPEMLKSAYAELLKHITDGRTVIENEAKKLLQFTGVIV